jgi:hypothetical protein
MQFAVFALRNKAIFKNSQVLFGAGIYPKLSFAMFASQPTIFTVIDQKLEVTKGFWFGRKFAQGNSHNCRRRRF